MKTLTYEYEKMIRAGQLLNGLVVTGTTNFRILAELSDILDSGKMGKVFEKEESKDGDMGQQEICENKLEKPAEHSDSTGSNESK